MLAFGASQAHDSLEWVFEHVDALTNQIGTGGTIVGQARATKYAADCVKFLKSGNWGQDNMISFDKVRLFLELTTFINYLSPQQRRLVSTVELKPDDILFNYAMRVDQQLRKVPHSHALSPVASTLSPPPVFPSQTSPVVSASKVSTSPQRPPRSCTYCHKDGHTYFQCYHRKKSARASSPEHKATYVPSMQFLGHTRSKPSSPGRRVHFHSSTQTRHTRYPSPASSGHTRHTRYPSPASSGHMRHARSPSPAPTPYLSYERPSKFCLVHGLGSHVSEECSMILDLQRKQVVTPSQSNFQRGRSQYKKM